MTIEKLIEELKKLKGQKREILVACDEEWNTIYKDIRIELTEYKGVGQFIIYGLSGSEQEERHLCETCSELGDAVYGDYAVDTENGVDYLCKEHFISNK